MNDQTKNNDDELNSNDFDDEKDQPSASDDFSNTKTSENIQLSETEKKVFSLLYGKKFQPATKIEKSSKPKHLILPKKLSPPANNEIKSSSSETKILEKKTRSSSYGVEIPVPSSSCALHSLEGYCGCNEQNLNPNVEKRKRSRKTPHLEVRKKICMFHMKKCERNIFSSPAFVEKLKHVIGKN